jgi:hypothetical protein
VGQDGILSHIWKQRCHAFTSKFILRGLPSAGPEPGAAAGWRSATTTDIRSLPSGRPSGTGTLICSAAIGASCGTTKADYVGPYKLNMSCASGFYDPIYGGIRWKRPDAPTREADGSAPQQPSAPPQSQPQSPSPSPDQQQAPQTPAANVATAPATPAGVVASAAPATTKRPGVIRLGIICSKTKKSGPADLLYIIDLV